MRNLAEDIDDVLNDWLGARPARDLDDGPARRELAELIAGRISFADELVRRLRPFARIIGTGGGCQAIQVGCVHTWAANASDAGHHAVLAQYLLLTDGSQEVPNGKTLVIRGFVWNAASQLHEETDLGAADVELGGPDVDGAVTLVREIAAIYRTMGLEVMPLDS